MRWENCLLLCKKVNSSIESQNVKFDEKISSGHNNKMGAKDDRKVMTYKILIWVFVNQKWWEIYGLICKKLELPIMLQNQ